MPRYRNHLRPPARSLLLTQHLWAALPLYCGTEAKGLPGSRGGFSRQDPTARKARLDDSPCLLPVASLSTYFACWRSWHRVSSE